MDDLQAILSLKQGDMRGLEYLITRYQARAVRAAFLITHDEMLAQDVVKDTFMRIHQRIRHFDENRPFEPYLMRSVTNAALNAAQKAAKDISYDQNADAVEGLLAQAATVESEVEYSQLKQILVAALSKLEPRQRTAIIQRYYLGMSEKEMALALDAPPGTIKWLLSTARARLRSLLGSEGSAK